MAHPESSGIGPRQSRNARWQVNQYVLGQGRELATGNAPLYMRRAEPGDLKTIARIIDDAKDRLHDLGTDQWSNDWLDEAGRGRMARVRNSIEKKNAWLAEFRIPLDAGIVMLPVATVTADPKGSTTVWKEQERRKYPAVYLSRLVVSTEFAGFDIGASMIDWAGRLGLKQRKAKSIRIDVWTTNTALHQYYLNRGFQDRGKVDDEKYPARQRFERLTSYESRVHRPVAQHVRESALMFL